MKTTYSTDKKSTSRNPTTSTKFFCLILYFANMRVSIFTLIFVFTVTSLLLGQKPYEIEGRVFSLESKEPLSYVNIYNLSLKKGTISNTDGFFRIAVHNEKDSIRLSFVGYKDQYIKLEPKMGSYTIYLEENNLTLAEVTITPDDAYLISLVQKCKKANQNVEQSSKAYYELKSFKDSFQVELVECYYNANVNGYQLSNLDLKAGRIALRPYQDHFFVSLDIANAITTLDIFDKNTNFPKNPFSMSKGDLVKNYYFYLDSKFLNGLDSVYVIDYRPKDTTGRYFEGKIWIDKTNSSLIKITLHTKNAQKHPFSALTRSDQISNVAFNITQSFKRINGKSVFNHTDFSYAVDYVSRIGTKNEYRFITRANAVLYLYDFEKLFFLPTFKFNETVKSEYRKISALPYNDFFWTNNDEYRVNDNANSNDRFYSEEAVLHNISFFSPSLLKKGLFEHAYTFWSDKRIQIKEILPDTTNQQASTNSASMQSNKFQTSAPIFSADQYKLSVQLCLDIDQYGDSTNAVTKTIFDPYESFYRLPIDNKTLCFVNIYFDLCEIKRRELEEKLKTVKNNPEQAKSTYETLIKNFELESNQYFNDVLRGTNEKEMRKYNAFVYDKLGIDNILLLRPYETEKQE